MNIYQDTIAECLGVLPIQKYIPDYDFGDIVNSEPFKDNVARGKYHPFYGQTISEEHKQIIRECQSGRVVSEITRKRLSMANKGKKPSDETRKKLSAASAGLNNPFYGKTHSVETRKIISEKTKGQRRSEEFCEKISKRVSGKGNPNYGGNYGMKGKLHNEDTKQKQREAALNRKRVECPKCGTEVPINLAKRWHFDNCKN